jgi:hypothetical protein
MSLELVALVKHDCPVCDQLLPALDEAAAAGAPVRILSQSSEEETAAQAARLDLAAVPELDGELELSARYDPDAVPALLLLDGADERDRVEGLQRDRIVALAARAGATLALDGLPEHRPGCASKPRDPEVAARLAAAKARADGRIRSRVLTLGGLEDPIEALHDRGLTDGLPVVPPTPERVVAMLEHTRRDPQDVVGEVPPYGAPATVEKVAVNAVLAGCPDDALPIVLAAVEAATEERFAMHGLLATTHPAGPAIVVSGPLADEIGMASGGNVLGQGNRPNLTIGRALQLVVRNVGGGRPGVEDRAAHGQAGKVGACFAERLDSMPWEPLAQARGIPTGDTGVTLMALEAPRLILDQLARTPEELVASFAMALESVGHPRTRLAMDALLLVGPEHGRLFAEDGWDRARLQDALFERTSRAAGELVRGADGCAEGIEAKWVTDPGARIPKFAAPDRIQIAYAGGDAGLFSMVFGSWVAGEVGSEPVTVSVEPWR